MKKLKLLPLLFTLSSTGPLSAKEPTTATIDPAAKAILQESIAALGGEEAMAKIKNRQISGTIIMGPGTKMDFVMTQQAPSKIHSKMVIPETMTLEQGFDGEKAWSNDSIQGFRELQGAELDQIKQSGAIFPELVIMRDLLSAKLLDDVEESDQTLKVIEVTSKDAPARTLYFDQSTKLLTKMSSILSTGPGGSMDVTMSFGDYQEKDGVKYPAKMVTDLLGQKLQMVSTEVLHNIEIDEKIFTMKK